MIKLILSAVANVASVHEPLVLEDLLHGEETRVYCDTEYAGYKAVIAQCTSNARGFTLKKGSRHRNLTDEERVCNRIKSKIRARGEHPFRIVKGLFGITKVCYQGLLKNANHLFACCILVNVVMAKKVLLKLRFDSPQMKYA